MAVVIVAAAIVGVATPPASLGDERPALLTYDRGSKTATLRLLAGQDDGYNFNGYSSGALTVAIPSGWRVTVEVRNASAATSHSALIVAWSDRFKGSGIKPALPGAAQPDFATGLTARDPPARFAFTTGAAAKYALICGVPGHNLIGMWDEFDTAEGGIPSYHVKGQ